MVVELFVDQVHIHDAAVASEQDIQHGRLQDF